MSQMMTNEQADPPRDAAVARRQAVMAVCAAATAAEIEAAIALLQPLPEFTVLRPAEGGLVMLRGRMGGDGRAFNLGEATVTRAAVRLSDGRTGFAYQLGRDAIKARHSAVLDGLVQGAEAASVERALQPVRERIDADAAQKRGRVAATKVNFFTMVRGED